MAVLHVSGNANWPHSRQVCQQRTPVVVDSLQPFNDDSAGPNEQR